MHSTGGMYRPENHNGDGRKVYIHRGGVGCGVGEEGAAVAIARSILPAFSPFRPQQPAFQSEAHDVAPGPEA